MVGEGFFPYETARPGQIDLMREWHKVLSEGGVLLANAPTGIGKTAAALSVALKHVVSGGGVVFFLTPRHTQHDLVVETVEKIGKGVRVVDLIGKKWMCGLPGASSMSNTDFSNLCKHLRDNGDCEFYNNFKSKSFRVNSLKVDSVIRECVSNRVCPYYYSVSLLSEAHLVVCDYYHMLNDRTRSKLLELVGKGLGECVIIFDEAHNLPDRAKELLSSTVTSNSLSSAIKECERFGGEVVEGVRSVLEFVKGRGSVLSGEEGLIDRSKLLNHLLNNGFLLTDLVKSLRDVGEEVIKSGEKRSFCNGLSEFLMVWSSDSDGLVRIVRKRVNDGKVSYSLSVECLDPSLVVGPVLRNARASLLMSGTLYPLKMYADLLGVENCVLKDYESPFPKENKLTLVVPRTTTKFSKRDENSFKNIGVACAKLVNAAPVNSAIFFPSYFIRNKVHQYFSKLCDKPLFLEEPGMSKDEKSSLFESFKSYSKLGGAVLMGVVSGSFSEGVDFPGDLLEMVVIVGVPLAKPDLVVKSQIKYYETKFGKGWLYGYTYPAINKVVQAAGRVIRSGDDRGVIVLLDERYVWDNYLQTLPKDVVVTLRPVERIKQFFSSKSLKK